MLVQDFSQYDPDPVIDESVGFSSQNVVQVGYDNLPESLKGKDKVVGLLFTYLKGIQDLENLSNKILVESELESASGAQLDMLGDLFGLRREGRSDRAYEQALEGRLAIINSNTTPNDLLSAYSILTHSDKVSIYEHFPASFSIASTMIHPDDEVEHELGTQPPDIADIIKQAGPLGVGVVTAYLYIDDNAKMGELAVSEGTMVLDNPLQPDDPNTPEDERDDLVIVSDETQPEVVDFLEYAERTEGSDFQGLGVLAEAVGDQGGLEQTQGFIDNWTVITEFGAVNLILIRANNPESFVGDYSGVFAEVLISGN